ncbi:hypothetical protein [Oceanobacillus sp. FSL H7-0719]|uniref:hypothetical protein n=1 Tax=Oceanobacillus sp. FSL H7-0719 TaxID=2954507 RepID=UPI00324F9690
MSKRYDLIDMQTDEIIVEGMTLDELRVFANDIFWSEDIDFSDSSIEDVLDILAISEYVTEEN